MKRSIIVALFAIALAVPAFADVTVKSSVTGKGMGMSGTMPSITYIKGNKMRNEITMGDTTRVSIFDLESQKMYVLDVKKKEADVIDMTQMAAQVTKSVQLNEMKSSLKPNGKTKTIAGKSAAGYDMEVTLPATMGGDKNMTMVVNMTGPVWIVKGGAGVQEYLAFYKNAVDKGWFFSDPRAAKAQPGQAKAMAEMYRQMAATGGIPYEQEMNIKITGDGPMAAMFAKMGNISTTTMVESVESGALAADLFAVPAGFKIKEQK